MNSSRSGSSTHQSTVQVQSLLYARILDIPNEVMDNITSNLPDWGLANFRTTSKCVHSVTLGAWHKRVLADKEDLPSLVWAAKFNKPSLVTILLTKFPGIDANMENWTARNKHLSPLSMAAYYGSEEAVRALCANGVDINYDNHEMQRASALHYSARANQPQMVKLLLELGADAHALTSHGSTAFHFAAKNNCYDALEALLDWGQAYPGSMPDIDRYDWKRRTALELAYLYREEDEEGILITVDYPFTAAGIARPEPEPEPEPDSESVSESEADAHFVSPIVWDIGNLYINNRRLIATYLIHLGSYSNCESATDKERIEQVLQGTLPVSFSFEYPSLCLAKLLVDYGAAIGKATSIPSLHTAIGSKDLELVHLILYAGEDINKIDAHGLAAIHILTMQPYSREYTFMALLYLETMGADMSMRNGAGKTPMQLAAISNWPVQIIETFFLRS